MTEPYLGEVQIFGFGFPPRNWALAAGQLLAIRQSSTLFALFGTQFGGDGATTFGLPNLASRQACGAGQSPGNTNRPLGSTFGQTAVALQTAEMPAHNHTLNAYATEDGAQLVAVPTMQTALGNSLGDDTPYGALGSGPTTMNPNAIGISGSAVAHANTQPYLGLNYSVALYGTYPYFS